MHSSRATNGRLNEMRRMGNQCRARRGRTVHPGRSSALERAEHYQSTRFRRFVRGGPGRTGRDADDPGQRARSWHDARVGFLHRGEDTGGDEDDLARVRAGGITDHAATRLGASSDGRTLFTSGLSVKEFALLGRLGPEPLAQVMGASVVRPGWQYLPALPPGSRKGLRTTGFGAVGPWAQPPGTSGYTAMYTEPSPHQVRGYLWGVDVVCELELLSDAWNTARRR